MREVIQFINGRAYKKEELLSKGKYKVLRVGNFFTNNSWYYSDLELPEDKYCNNGDLLYAWSASFGPKIWKGDKTIFHYHIWNLRYSEILFRDYLYFYLLFDTTQVKKSTTGSTMIHVSMENMNPRLIPIPPLNEQQRIVTKIESVIPTVDKYETSQMLLNQLNTEIFDKLKKSVLQEAIQGKLVSQDPNDEPASVLLERIREEKQRLLKEGKLKKKDITDSLIFKGDDNKYYEQIGYEVYEIETEMQFPATWEIVRLGDICRLVDGEKRSGAYPCLDAKYLRGKSAATILQTGKFVRTGDNVILVDEENSGEVFYVPVDGYMGSTFKQLWISSEVHLPYVLHFVLFYKEQLRNSKKGAAIPHLNKDIFYNLLVGVPPLKEQQRLSESVTSLFSKLR
jgi:type I restriction enzyme S subunit